MALAPNTILILSLVLAVVGLTWLHYARLRAGRMPHRRPLPALDVLRLALARGAETGQPVHVAPGASVLGAADGSRSTAAELVAGLLLAERTTSEAALNGAPVLVSSGDAIAHLALRGSLHQAYQIAGQAQDFDPAHVQLLAHQDELAYAAGVGMIYARQPLEASAMVGSFTQSVLLIGEEGAERDLPQLFGTAGSAALPLMKLTSEATLIGEEIYAAEAYMASSGTSQARLLTQDALRTVVIVLLLGGFVYSLLQPLLGLPALPTL